MAPLRRRKTLDKHRGIAYRIWRERAHMPAVTAITILYAISHLLCVYIAPRSYPGKLLLNMITHAEIKKKKKKNLDLYSRFYICLQFHVLNS